MGVEREGGVKYTAVLLRTDGRSLYHQGDVFGCSSGHSQSAELCERVNVWYQPEQSKFTMLIFFFMIFTLIPHFLSFRAYDCTEPDEVRAYSLIEPEACTAAVDERNFVRTVFGEVVQLKQERHVPVFRCQVIESTFSQYCGMFSAAGVTRYLKFREPYTVEPRDCRAARNTGKLAVRGRVFNATIGTTTSHTIWLSGGLSTTGRCSVAPLRVGESLELEGQAAQAAYEITLSLENAYLHDLSGRLRIGAPNIIATYGDGSTVDSREGTFTWDNNEADSCPNNLVNLYSGPIKVLSNSSDNLAHGFALIENLVKNQVAGLELGPPKLICSSTGYTTHLTNLMVITHVDKVKILEEIALL